LAAALVGPGDGNVIVFRHVDRRRPFLWESDQHRPAGGMPPAKGPSTISR
jgi:hypothetical protein